VLSEEFSAAFTTPACRAALLDVVGGSTNNVDDAVVVTALRLLGCTRTVAQPRLADDASSPPTSIAVPRRSYVPPHLRRDWARGCHICAGTQLQRPRRTDRALIDLRSQRVPQRSLTVRCEYPHCSGCRPKGSHAHSDDEWRVLLPHCVEASAHHAKHGTRAIAAISAPNSESALEALMEARLRLRSAVICCHA
jgi:hypothetical protein